MLTKDELIRLLEENNIEDFNSAILEFGEDGADLSEVDFSNMNLSGVNFTNAILNSAGFSDAHLSEIDFTNCDLTSADFTRSTCVECNFSEALLNGTDFSYSTVDYGNFTEADMAGAIFNEADLSNSDFTCSYNLSACRFDEATTWPDNDLLPDNFDPIYSDDLSSLKDDEDYSNSDY